MVRHRLAPLPARPTRPGSGSDDDEQHAAWAQWAGWQFYVSVRDGERAGLLAGPFPTRTVALRWVQPTKEVACARNDRARWYAFGTCSSPAWTGPGRLNGPLGLAHCRVRAWCAAA